MTQGRGERREEMAASQRTGEGLGQDSSSRGPSMKHIRSPSAWGNDSGTSGSEEMKLSAIDSSGDDNVGNVGSGNDESFDHQSRIGSGRLSYYSQRPVSQGGGPGSGSLTGSFTSSPSVRDIQRQDSCPNSSHSRGRGSRSGHSQRGAQGKRHRDREPNRGPGESSWD